MSAKSVVLGSVALGAVLLAPPAAKLEHDGCSGFSQEANAVHARITWAFRFCRTAEKRELQLRFRNASPERVRMTYELWLQPPSNCRSRRSSAATGAITLLPGATTPWPYERHEIRGDESYRGSVWLCLGEMAKGGSDDR